MMTEVPVLPVVQTSTQGRPRRFPPTVTEMRAREGSARNAMARYRAAQAGLRPGTDAYNSRRIAERVAIDAERGPLPGEAEYPEPPPRADVRHKQRHGAVVIDPRVGTMWEMFADEGDNFREIGDWFGLSRERVRQVVCERYGQAMIDLARFRNDARLRLRRWVDTAESMTVARCSVCGVRWPSGRPEAWWTMCDEHEPHRGAFMLMCDEDRHAKHAEITMRYYRASGRARNGSRASGKVRRRWLIRGSRMHAVCTVAYALGWPIVDRLPEQILEQLANEADYEWARALADVHRG